MLSAVDTRRLADFAAAGGRVVVGYATGLIDENFHTWLGGYPGAGNGLLRDMLGIRGGGIQHPRQWVWKASRRRFGWVPAVRLRRKMQPR